MSVRTIVTCDNCGQEEPFLGHVRNVTIVMMSDGCSDPGMDDIDLPFPTFHLCGYCADKVRHALNDARPGEPDPKASDD